MYWIYCSVIFLHLWILVFPCIIRWTFPSSTCTETILHKFLVFLSILWAERCLFILRDLLKDAGLLTAHYNKITSSSGAKTRQVCLLPFIQDLGFERSVLLSCAADPLHVQAPSGLFCVTLSPWHLDSKGNWSKLMLVWLALPWAVRTFVSDAGAHNFCKLTSQPKIL